MMEVCEQCGHLGMRYSGVVDGMGDYGEDLCDEYTCPNCAHSQTGECFENQEGEDINWDEMADDHSGLNDGY